jgi:uncharacterized protein YcfL
MLKKILPAGLLAAMMLAGCTGPISPDREGIAPTDYPQVTLESYWLQARLVVSKPDVHQLPNGQLSIKIPIRTRTDYDLKLDYQIQYMKNGVQAEPPTSWIFVQVPRKGTAEIDPPSNMSPADDFRVLIRRAQ